MDDDLATLCQACGMCCDGSLFDCVTIEPDELEVARRHRLPMLHDDVAAEQPCAALATSGDGPDARHACTIYDARPRACRRFTCRLYARHAGGGVALEAGLAVVRRVRELFARLDASGLAVEDFDDLDALAARGPDGARAAEHYRELIARLEGDFARA